MKTVITLAATALVLLGGPAMAANSHTAYQGEKLAKHAKVKIDDAKQIALKARPGMVIDQELEKEKGGSGLRYSFGIKADGKTYEVGVDAKSGAILENAPEGKNPD